MGEERRRQRATGGGRVYVIYGGIQLVDSGGTHAYGVQGKAIGGGVHVAGGAPDSKVVKGLPWHWPRGDDVEVSGGCFYSPSHSLHHLPQLPPRISGGSRHSYRHPRGQAALAVSGLGGKCHVCDLPGSAQGI